MKLNRIAFIGAGNMARSMIGGLLAAGVSADRLSAADPDPKQLAQLSITTRHDNRATVENAEVVVLAVKPQVMQLVCAPLRESLRPDALIISIAAGVRVSSLEQWLGARAIVRCMPNTPALLRSGITALYANTRCTIEQRKVAEEILASIGTTIEVTDESQLDTVTALSGSGPAYFFRFMEAMVATGVELGIAAPTARTLVVETMLGAARMAKETGTELGALRASVTSPKGTTESALQTFERLGLAHIVAAGVRAAHQRSLELAEELAAADSPPPANKSTELP